MADSDIACIVLELAADDTAYAETAIIPALVDAGLVIKAFKGVKRMDDSQSTFVLVSASKARLLQEAHRAGMSLLLDPSALEEADKQRNRAMGRSFQGLFSDGDVEHMDLRIPRLTGSCLKALNPYDFIYGPYVPSPQTASLYHEHVRTGFCMSAVDSLKALKAIIEAPGDALRNGAGLNLDKLRNEKRILRWFPAHNETERKQLSVIWLQLCRPFLMPPLDAIRGYYGERIALYFYLSSFFTLALIAPGLFGLALFIDQVRYDHPGVSWLPAFGMFVSLWSTVMWELWKRRQSSTAMQWGQTNLHISEPYRPEYIASPNVSRQRSPIDGKLDYVEASAWQRLRMTCSYSIISTALGIVVVLVGVIFWLRVVLVKKNLPLADSTSSVVNAVQIQLMNLVYNVMARRLTEWENLPTESMYMDSLIIKLSVFYSINSYAGLIYIAAIKNSITLYGPSGNCRLNQNGQPDCMDELRDQLAVLLIVRLVMATFFEHILPWLMQASSRAWAACRNRKDHARIERVKQIVADMSPIEKSSLMRTYDSFEDYLEVLILFGYVSLFVTAFPLAPFVVLLGQGFSARLDASKLLYRTVRPMPEGAADIGAWGLVMESFVFVSVITNLTIALLANHSPFFGRSLSNEERLIFFVIAEHVILLLKLGLSAYIPDRTFATTLQLKRQEYLVGKHILGSIDRLPSAEDKAVSQRRLSAAGGPLNVAPSYAALFKQAPPHQPAGINASYGHHAGSGSAGTTPEGV